MMAALGLGALPAAIFHLVTHASFKALLFMVAGNVNHATGTFNMRYMGGLRKTMPLTYILVLIGGLSLVGIIPLAGFWSKDEILSAAWTDGWQGGGPAALWAGKLTLIFLLTGVLLTAFYTFRMIYMTFHGEFRGGAEQEQADLAAAGEPGAGHHGGVHLAEAPILMWFPMVLLGIVAVASGYLINPQWVEAFGIPKHWVSEFLIEGLEATRIASLAHLEVPAFNRWMAAASTVIALAGIGLASLLYLRRSAAAKDPLEAIKPVHVLLSRKYFIDDLYEDVIVRRLFYRGFVKVVDWVDRVLVDGIVDVIGLVSRNVGPHILVKLQSGEVQAYGIALTLGSLLILLGFLVF
jgi:NADH-quinone oxidoreductase subunit L